MPIFKYQALNSEKKTLEGLIEALSEQEAENILISKGLRVFFVKEQTVKKKNLNQLNFSFKSKVKVRDLVIFFRQFSVMISANISMVQALKVVVEQTQNITLKMLISEIADEVDGGSRLSDAMEKHPKIFSGFHVNLVRGGESSGKLNETLGYLADEMEKDYDMMSKIKGAMTYPIFVLVSLFGVGIVMMVYVVPKLTAILEETGGELPIATRILISTSEILQNYWLVIISAIIGFIVLFRFLAASDQGSLIIDKLFLKIPIFGNLFKKIYLVRFSRSMSTLISGGITVNDSLGISSQLISNKVFSLLISETKREVEDGSPIAVVFKRNKEIPQIVSQMIDIGEKTGKLDIVFARVADFYSREVSNTISNLMTLLEPVIMIIMGVAVGIMVAAIILPMYNMASQV